MTFSKYAAKQIATAYLLIDLLCQAISIIMLATVFNLAAANKKGSQLLPFLLCTSAISTALKIKFRQYREDTAQRLKLPDSPDQRQQ